MDMTESQAHELVTLRDLMRWAASRFSEAGIHCGHGLDNVLDEAVYLVLYALGLPPDLDASWFDSRLTTVERGTALELLVRRVEERRPAAYLTHEAWFCGLSFYVDERVLIPRSPLAELIETAFEAWIDPARVQRIADVGTGSGCIGIACAYAFPEAEVDLVDISHDALDVARINIARHGVGDRVHARYSDALSDLRGLRYDLIVSNPPYVDAADMAALSPEFRHEPALGLAAGEDGLDVVMRILDDAAECLNPGGILFVEVGNSAPALQSRLPGWPLTWLEFERGGTGVFMLTREEIIDVKDRARGRAP